MEFRVLQLAVLATAVFFGGCQTFDPYTGEEKTSNTTRGALIGAAAGAVVGLVSGDDAVERRKRALIGAGVGALEVGLRVPHAALLLPGGNLLALEWIGA